MAKQPQNTQEVQTEEIPQETQQMTPETALSNLITVYKQSRLTPEEHEIMRMSIQTLIALIQRSKVGATG